MSEGGKSLVVLSRIPQEARKVPQSIIGSRSTSLFVMPELFSESILQYPITKNGYFTRLSERSDINSAKAKGEYNGLSSCLGTWHWPNAGGIFTRLGSVLQHVPQLPHY